MWKGHRLPNHSPRRPHQTKYPPNSLIGVGIYCHLKRRTTRTLNLDGNLAKLQWPKHPSLQISSGQTWRFCLAVDMFQLSSGELITHLWQHAVVVVVVHRIHLLHCKEIFRLTMPKAVSVWTTVLGCCKAFNRN